MTTPQARPRTRVIDAGDAVAVVFGLGWVACLVHILRHKIFVTHDSLISYAHVWYVSERLWHDHRVPMAMPVLGHGRAFAFPYGFLPWFTGAIFRPLLGDWVVTLLYVVGTCALLAVTFLAFPELRRGWWAAAALANPALLQALLLGQLPFIWAATLLLGAVACWRRDRRSWATVLLALAQATHPAVIMPLALGLVIGALRHERRPRDLLTRYALSLVPALPAAVLVLRSPVYAESSTLTRAWGFVDTVGPRCLVLVVPLLLVWIKARRPDRLTGAAVVAALLVTTAAMWVPIAMPQHVRDISHHLDHRMLPFLASPVFHPGDTYRLLRVGDHHVGMYQLLRAGGRADAEFFPESALTRSWPSEAAYSRMLRDRDVDVVMLWTSYDVAHTNEQHLLDALVARPPARCDGSLVCVRLTAATHSYRVYSVTRSGHQAQG